MSIKRLYINLRSVCLSVCLFATVVHFHCQNMHTDVLINLFFLPDANSSKYLNFLAFSVAYLGQ